MKKTTTKGASKTASKKASKNLEVKPAKGGTVRGGEGIQDKRNNSWSLL